MTPAGFRLAMSRLNLDTVEDAMRVFGRSRRTVFYWRRQGPPEHVAMAVHHMIEGRMQRKDVRKFIEKTRTRDDGERYST